MYEIQTGSENKILRSVAEKVTVFNGALKNTIEEMKQTMLEPDPKTEIRGIGLAANQVGILKRIILITLNVGTNKKHKVITMINPEILESSDQTVCMEEGCLSLPDEFANINRPSHVKVRWQNENGNICEKRLRKWDARVFLHEYDHLEGVLFTDHLKSQ